MPKLRIDQYLTILFLSISLLLFPKTIGSFEEKKATNAELIETFDGVGIENVAPIPVLKNGIDLNTQQDFTNTLSSRAVYVMDVNSGSILLQKNADQERAPASTTKMLTALTARKIYQLDQVFEVKEEAFTQGNGMELEIGEQITVQNLLNGLLIASGNDAAFTLANNHPLGYQGFITQMENLAQELNLDNTFFTNPSGLDSEKHKTTAHDLAIMAKEIMKDDFLKSIVGTKSKVISDVSGSRQHQLENTNSLLGVEAGVVGIKTGTTWEAGETLVTQVDRDDKSIIIVVMGSQNRYDETKAVIDWVFENYQWLPILIN